MPDRRKRRYSKKSSESIDIAKGHIVNLFDLAKQVAHTDAKLADRYVSLARTIAMKFKIRLPSEYKRLFCPHCYKFLLPGKNLRVRAHEHRLIYYCLECKRFWRKPLKAKRSANTAKTPKKRI